MLRFNHHSNDWLLGFPSATGRSIKDSFLEHVRYRDIAIVTSALLSAIEQEENGFVLTFSNSTQPAQIKANFLVIASGTRPRAPVSLFRLASQCPDKIFVGAGELCVDDFVAGMHAAILGGGDNAFENAYHLASRGIHVDVYYRAGARARSEWVNRCEGMPNISLRPNTITSQFALSGNKVSFLANGNAVQVDALSVMYGYEPNTDIFKGIAPWIEPAIDSGGFLKVNSYQQTSIPRLYAIGDVTDRPLPCLPLAIAQGSLAAKAIALDFEGVLP
jgi:thioredoxin reductase